MVLTAMRRLVVMRRMISLYVDVMMDILVTDSNVKKVRSTKPHVLSLSLYNYDYDSHLYLKWLLDVSW